jgi:hypothetical protein
LLKKSLNRWLKVDPISIIRQILSDRAILNWIEEANRKQLLEGKNSFDVKLSDIGGGYSDFTLQNNTSSISKTRDKVNLYDTGEFHDSITVKVDTSLLQIDADPIKTDEFGNTTNLFSEWGEDIIGLNEENLQQLIETIKDKLIVEILKQV